MFRYFISFIISLTALCIGMAIYWVSSGSDWSYGELGSYIGGSLGGIAVIILVYTTFSQQQEIDRQNDRAEQEAIRRQYEILYNEITGNAAQIIYHSMKAGCISLIPELYELKRERMQAGDRGVFLRIILEWHKTRREEGKENIRPDLIAVEDEERRGKIFASINRFQDLCSVIFDDHNNHAHADLYKALWATEIGRAYKVIKDIK